MKSPQIPGFFFAGLNCGIKADSKKKDLALIYASEPKTSIAGVFTQNQVCAAPVTLCRQNLKSGKGNGRLIVVNSGCANAATGAQGLKNAQQTITDAAKLFLLKPNQVFVCSTGKIGPHLPMAKIKNGIALAARELNIDGFQDAAEAICTTDAYVKTACHQGRLGSKNYSIGVFAKGAGMIHPDMATMLCFVTTDLKIKPAVLQALVKESVDQSLNALSVDGDTSTNDTVLAMASGVADNVEFAKGSKEYTKIQQVLTKLLKEITILIAKDGEGATKCFHVVVTGAKTPAAAKKIAHTVGNSPLVKSAMYGCDPNWGRILCAVGYAGVPVDARKIKITIGKIPVYRGKPILTSEAKAALYLRQNEVVEVHVELGSGKAQSEIYASDLTPEYVKFNADYST